jgi:Ricin-type beta-trefoil lectin domain
VIHAWDNSCLDWIDQTAYGKSYNQLQFDACGYSSWNWVTPSWTQDSLGALHDTSSGECMANYPSVGVVTEGICGLWGGIGEEDMAPIEQTVDPSLVYAYFPVISENLVMGVEGTVAPGAHVSIMEAAAGAQQTWGQWRDGAIVLYDYGNICLTAASATSGAEVTLEWCGEAPNQVWVPVYPHQMVLEGTELCLDVPAISLTPGTNLEVWECNGGLNQQFNAPPFLSYY